MGPFGHVPSRGLTPVRGGVTRVGRWAGGLSSLVLRSGQIGIWVNCRELLGGAAVDEFLVQEPFDGTSLGSNVMPGMPSRDQFGMVLVELVLEPSECSLPLKDAGKAAAGRLVGDALGEVDQVLVPDVRRQRIDRNVVQLIDLNGVLPIDARVAGPERHVTRALVDEPSVVIIGLIRERGINLLNIDQGQVEHLVRLGPEPSFQEGCVDRDLASRELAVK